MGRLGPGTELAPEFYAAAVPHSIADEMRRHLAEPFPEVTEKGVDYGGTGCRHERC